MITSGLKIRRYLLIIGDIIILYFSLWLTLGTRYGFDEIGGVWPKHLVPFTIIFVVWLIIFYIDELYDFNFNQGRVNLINRLVRVSIINGGLAIIFFYFAYNRFFSIKPQRVLLINLVIVFLLLYLWRQIFYYFIKLPKLTMGLAIIGLNNLAMEVIKEINDKPQLGFQLKLIIINNQKDLITKLPPLPKETKIIDNLENFKNLCLEQKIEIITSSINPRNNPWLVKNLFDCLPLKISFFDLATFYEKITGKIPVETIEQVWFLENLTESSKKIYEITKKFLDIILSLFLIIASLPFIPFIAILIKLDSEGPILFTQNRVGKNGKIFLAMKFRTMVPEAERDGPQWATKDDYRITKIGRILRKMRIDEIPQLINVLRGEMSLIGPRPERPEFVEMLQKNIPFYKERLLVKPGITGWAQVNFPYGASVADAMKKLQYDLFYIKNRSFALDLSILLKTIRIILSGRGQ